jgi:hypothetical protein
MSVVEYFADWIIVSTLQPEGAAVQGSGVQGSAKLAEKRIFEDNNLIFWAPKMLNYWDKYKEIKYIIVF